MKKTVYLLLFFLIYISACEKENLSEQPIFIEPSIEFKTSDSTYIYPYQSINELWYYYKKDLNPDYINIGYSLEFSSGYGWFNIEFFERFKIDDLENPHDYFVDVQNNHPGVIEEGGILFENKYKPSENELLKIFNASNKHFVNSTYKNEGGIYFYHSEYLFTDLTGVIHSNISHSTDDTINQHFSLKLTKIPNNNFETDYTDYDITPEMFLDAEFLYHGEMQFDALLVENENGDTLNVQDGVIDFVLY